MNYPIINVSAFLSCHTEAVSIFVILYFVIKKINNERHMPCSSSLCKYVLSGNFSILLHSDFNLVCSKAPQS